MNENFEKNLKRKIVNSKIRIREIEEKIEKLNRTKRILEKDLQNNSQLLANGPKVQQRKTKKYSDDFLLETLSDLRDFGLSEDILDIDLREALLEFKLKNQ